ncbi:MAG: hypothetical protein LBL60_00435 [Mycoplasmataceae bacterium]|nr:hypothetical protein [Mycoplasmataceae bacterium]
MNNTFYIKDLGSLVLDDILMEYDHPIIFTCIDGVKTKYLFYEINSSQHYEWIVVRVSDKRCYEIKTNKISIQKAFKNSEIENEFYKISVKDNKWTKENINSLNNSWFSDNETFIGKSIDNVDDNKWLQTVDVNKSIVDLKYNTNTNKHDIDTKTFEKVIHNANDFFSIWPNQNVNACTLPGSCIIRFTFDSTSSLFDDADEDPAFNVINKVFDNINDNKIEFNDIFDDTDKKNDEKNYVKVKDFLNCINETKPLITYRNKKLAKVNRINVQDSVYKINNFVKKIDFKIEEIKKNISTIEKEYDGYFIGFSFKNKSFDFASNNEKIHGDIDENLSELNVKVSDVKSNQYKIKLNVSTNSISGKKTNILKSIEELS